MKRHEVGCVSYPPLETVPRVELERYRGTWYEIGYKAAE